MTTVQKTTRPTGEIQPSLIIEDGRGDEEEPLTTHAAGWRQIVTLVACVGFFCMYSLRINMGVALVAMVNHTYVAEMANASNGGGPAAASICVRNFSTTTQQDAELNLTSPEIMVKKKEGKYKWDSATQGIILSSFFYGYIMTQFIGGVLAGKYGAKWVFGIGNVMTGVFTLLSPAAAEIGLAAFVAVRVMQGFSSGVTWPSMQAFFARWAPPSERGTLPAIAYAGSFIGTPLTFIISGVLADTVGWPSIFYVF
uniref:Major facilitator superfamily (MFS) profile domain-containing protein n=1 Tax=Romanomermis culicivorax TaxID=13658 RepID=A0A915J7Q2_ROMCU